MAQSQRKLLAEVDRTLKKVDEGLLLFDDIMDKMNLADSAGHRDRMQGELKQEIKKLQRLRENIKSWASGTEVKDKSKLLEARKSIEARMELFRATEREAKTKAYSKEGLSRSNSLDPRDQDKQDKSRWISECLDRLQVNMDEYDAEMEILRGKKKPDRAKVTSLEEKIKQHRFHVENLEQLLRLLENDQIDPDQVDDVQDQVDMFLDDPEEAEQLFDDTMYLDIIESAEEQYHVSSAPFSKASVEEIDAEELLTNPRKPVTPSPTIKSPAKEDVAAMTSAKTTKTKKPKKDIPVSNSAPSSVSAPKEPAIKPAPPPKVVGTKSFKDVAAGKSEVNTNSGSLNTSPSGVGSPLISPSIPAVSVGSSSILPNPGSVNATAYSNSVYETGLSVDSSDSSSRGVILRSSMDKNVGNLRLPVDEIKYVSNQNPPVSMVSQSMNASPPLVSLSSPSDLFVSSATPSSSNTSPSQTSAYSLEGTVGVDPAVLRAVDLSFSQMPLPVDSERIDSYTPRYPFGVPSSFPQVPLPIFENPSLIRKLDTDTLFFIFYYQQGTYQQYLAGKELKKQSWRFHKKYSTWFQRHEKPKETTDEYEEGTYVFFDFESGFERPDDPGWCQRIKTDFKFEYAFLEDEH